MNMLLLDESIKYFCYNTKNKLNKTNMPEPRMPNLNENDSFAKTQPLSEEELKKALSQGKSKPSQIEEDTKIFDLQDEVLDTEMKPGETKQQYRQRMMGELPRERVKPIKPEESGRMPGLLSEKEATLDQIQRQQALEQKMWNVISEVDSYLNRATDDDIERWLKFFKDNEKEIRDIYKNKPKSPDYRRFLNTREKVLTAKIKLHSEQSTVKSVPPPQVTSARRETPLPKQKKSWLSRLFNR